MYILKRVKLVLKTYMPCERAFKTVPRYGFQWVYEEKKFQFLYIFMMRFKTLSLGATHGEGTPEA